MNHKRSGVFVAGSLLVLSGQLVDEGSQKSHYTRKYPDDPVFKARRQDQAISSFALTTRSPEQIYMRIHGGLDAPDDRRELLVDGRRKCLNGDATSLHSP